MPRTARNFSNTDVYHIMLRGVNKQQIFYDEEDYIHFIVLLQHYKQICGFELFAYCLMGNHLHLLMRASNEPLETVFRRIGSSFVYWYNIKYSRTGHLFQDRYLSEPVKNNRSFLIVLRYILQNPVAAGISPSPELYPYSSAAEYLSAENGITDKAMAFAIMDERSLREFLLEQNDDVGLEIDETVRKRYTDTTAKELILKEFGTYSPQVKSIKDRSEFNLSICSLLQKGISIRQLSRLTGVSKSIIERSIKAAQVLSENTKQKPTV